MGCACLSAAALPGLAAAVPPDNDNYLSSIRIYEPGSTLPAVSTRGNDTIIEATVELDESTGCVRPGFPQVDFGSTVWYDIYPHRSGFVRLVAE